MPVYLYEAKDLEGKKVTGEVFGDSQQLALSSLKLQKLFPLKLVEKKEKAQSIADSRDLFKKKVKKKQITVFTRQFASMLKAGVPLPVIMDVLIKQERNDTFKEILQAINNDILSGNTLSRAMMRHKVFPSLLVSMVEVGEANGRLDMAFERIAVTMEKELKLSAKVKGAMIYPAVLLLVSIIASCVLTFVVLPVFSRMFEQMGVPLPRLTRTFIDVSRFMTVHWYLFAAVVLALVIIFVKLLREPALKTKLDHLLLKLPVIGKVQNVVYMARFCRTFSTLVEGGVEVVASLETVRNVITNHYIKNYFNDIIRDIQAGTTIHAAVSKIKFFPPLVVSMIRIGEESGRLGDILSKTADLYEDESETQLQKLTALMEPAITVLMAVGIGAIVVSVVQPMFQMYEIIGK